MVKRLLDATASDFLAMNGTQLAESIRLADGRTLAAEVICTDQSPVDGISQGELAAAMGADIIALDRYDPLQPHINGVPESVLQSRTPLLEYKQMLGRPLAVNMIVAEAASGASLGGRLASTEHARLMVSQGADIIFLYARPHMGGSFDLQQETAHAIKQALTDKVLLVGVPSFATPAPRIPDAIHDFEQAIAVLIGVGCDGIALPMPGSKAGWQVEVAAELVDTIHAGACLAWLFITGSIESAPQQVMHTLALQAKHIGADAVRIDEAGLSGMPTPENILALSLALRGRRHTYRRMGQSVRR